MKPILYAPGETNFDHNGIGTLAETTSCTVSEERNGAFELELKYPVNGRLYKNIEEGCIVKAKPNDISDPQLFYIYRSTKPLDGFVTFYGEHISYELSGNPVEGVEVVDEIAQNAMQQIFAAALLPHPYTAYSDITTRNGTSIKRASLRAALGGVEGSVLSVWGGEYEFDNFTVKLHSARGRETGIKIAYGKNLTDLQQEKNISEVYCGVFPYAKYTPQPTEGGAEQPEEVVITLSEKIVWSPHAASYARKRVCIKDFSDRFNGADGITEEQLREVVEAWVETSGFDVPAVSITVSFVNLWNSPEYAKYALLERVNLCDTVSVDFPKLGVSATAKIVKTKYDVLNEKYLTLTLGSVKANFADTVNQTSAAIAQTKQEIKDTSAAIEVDIKKAVDEATQAITGQSGGYVVLNPPKNPQEILIMDAPTIAEAKKIWRWNSGGLGYSKNGYNGPFGTAITQDGAIVADYITVGKVGALNIDVAGVIRAGSLAVLGDVEIEAKRAKSAENALSSRITVNAESITAEVERATAAEGTLSSRITATAEEIAAEVTRAKSAESTLSSRISATAEEISAEVTRAEGAENALSSRISANATAITAKVSSTGGSSSSFGWSLTSSGFYLYSGNKTVMKATSSGLEVIGKITANSGSFAGSIVATNDASSDNKTLINENGIYFGHPFNTNSPSYIGSSDYSINNEGGEWAMTNIAIYSAPTITVVKDAWYSGLWYLQGWTITPDRISLRASYNGNDGTTITKNGTITASDRNVKNNIFVFSKKYDVLFDHLIPRIYRYNSDTEDQVHSGFVAQEVGDAINIAGLERKDFAALCVEYEGTSTEKWGLMYDEFVSLNTWQIQLLKARVAELEKKLST